MQAGQSQAAVDVVQEVWELVEEYHVNPHGERFDHARWVLSVTACHTLRFSST